MAYRVNHHDKKRPANKLVCVGEIDRETVEFIPFNRELRIISYYLGLP